MPLAQQLIPGAHATKYGIPDGCVQLPVFNHNSEGVGSLHQTHFFLIDQRFERALLDEPIFGVWRYEARGTCEHAVWYTKACAEEGVRGSPHYLIDSIWRLAEMNAPPPGGWLAPRNYDWLDLRLSNLKPIIPRQE